MEASRSADKYAKYRSAKSINPFPKGSSVGKPVTSYGKRNKEFPSKLEQLRAKQAEEEENKKLGKVKESKEK